MEGKLASLPTATRDNYDFTGWYTPAGEPVTAETVYTADTVLTAGWAEIPMATITVTGTGNSSYCYLTMPDGTKVSGAGTHQIKKGETIACRATSQMFGNSKIVVNGETVKTGAAVSYDYVVSGKNATINLAVSGASTITITET